jgi:uncharacterized protein YkwD
VRFSGRRTIVSILLLSATLAASAGTAAPASATTILNPSERRMVYLINKARMQANLPALHYSATLSGLARTHSALMAKHGTIFHTYNLGYVLRNFSWSLAGENVGMGSTIDLLHQAFMHSPAHRRNNLERRFHRIGVGVVWKNGVAFITVDFLS